MALDIPVTRRTFLKVVGSGAVVVISISNLPAAILNASMQIEPDNGPAWAPEPGKARWRIDGMPKVTGQKIYARDFKARDFAGWPKQENWLYALRCAHVDRTYEGYNLSMLPRELQPIAIVDNDALRARNIALAPEPDPIAHQDIYWFARKGQPADCYGQPAALLIFADFDTYRRARKLLEFNDQTIRYGVTVNPGARSAPVAFSPKTTYVRDDDLNFNYVKDFQTDDKGNPTPEYLKTLAEASGNIDATIQANEQQGTWFKAGASDNQGFITPAMDPMFMEPEAGLAWYNTAMGELHLVLGTQSASEDAGSAASLFASSEVHINGVHIIACYPGGGFGGRDRSYFPLYLALAAPFAKGALRWQQSRYEQFQVGLKRCETQFTESLWFDRQGKIQALKCNFTMNGGGKKNLSPYVAQLASLSAMSCYEIPRASTTAESLYTPEVFGGSQRGFGGPQAFMAIETLMDEAALELSMSPFAIRRANLLGSAPSLGRGRAITGAPILFDLQLSSVLERLEEHSLWQTRDKTRAQFEAKGLKYGVGLAMANEAFGTSGDGMYGMVQILPDGALRVITTYTDMGNGAATSLGLAPSEYLGQNAQTIAMSVFEPFQALGLSGTRDPQKPTDVRFTSGSSSACLGAFHQYHAVKGAAQVLLLQSVLPAAAALWHANVTASDIKWVDGALTAQGMSRPLPWSDLLERMRSMNLPTVAAVHASYAGSFWTGTYTFTVGPADIEYDYVAVGSAPDSLTPLQRELHQPLIDGSKFQRTTYAPSASLVALVVDPANGRVKVEHVVSSVSVGRQICPELVEGQSQGAVAMGIGNVLSETCPLGHEGPGGGRWNLDRYQIARLSDIPAQTLIALPPPNDDPCNARGIAEAVMCPIAPALLNALAMATGHRFRQTPVTPEQIRGVLQ
ncbi:xanthine dehydrogenase family protein molybdopterin-binding subunit [Paraburkholderia hayleyella]|uniref:xanthine dehydrogenase family protein molybdopterin-binding subunit n=1 Tax=Paraburkholderia hayleyella TaxID=2152889 RepID=UPI001292240C|nr:molybdopterin cofactor-binding domain-containing protein [Paraburkholderia hayleyella]